MPTVRCPSCKRMLNVREEQIGQDAQCPICAAVFPAEPEGGRAVPYQPPVHAPDPTRPWRPAGADTSAPGPSGESSALDVPPDDNAAADRVRLAGAWLLALAIANLSWNVTCGCASLFALMEPLAVHDGSGLLIGGAYLLQLVFQMVILAAGQALRNVRNRTLCWVGVILALLEGVFLLGRAFLMLSALERMPGGEEVSVGFNCVTFLLSGALFLAGWYGARVLTDPHGVTREQRRRRDEDD